MRSRPKLRWAEPGWVLLEVLIAVVLLGTALGALVTSATALSSREIGLQHAVEGLSAGSTEANDSWRWHSLSLVGTWSAGPQLTLHTYGDTSGGESASTRIGLWIAGWKQADVVPDHDGSVTIAPAAWRSHTGKEVVARIWANQTWGPPWRTVVPDATGKNLASRTAATPKTSRGSEIPSALFTLEATPSVVIHSPWASSAAPQLLTDAAATPCFGGLPFTGLVNGPMVESATFGGQTQCWRAEPGRNLDVYF